MKKHHSTIHTKKGAKETEPIHERYIAFATNMNHKEVFKLYPKIPEEYRKRWGIETGFRAQNTIKAKTTSPNYTITLIYHMLSTILYNIWILANITLLQQLKKELTRPIIKLTHLTRTFRHNIELNKPPYPPSDLLFLAVVAEKLVHLFLLLLLGCLFRCCG